ncbi:unnamed protein product [Nesidiocoris tenuis]|uniref:Uncharacterized protein n=1 Tax=Nesidiocoris tenuis TaxID=355587 RepID=A0A6H5GCZ5_9HEMI|nr:unnamed protein product [Nesidiocoris tenuis]
MAKWIATGPSDESFGTSESEFRQFVAIAPPLSDKTLPCHSSTTTTTTTSHTNKTYCYRVNRPHNLSTCEWKKRLTVGMIVSTSSKDGIAYPENIGRNRGIVVACGVQNEFTNFELKVLSAASYICKHSDNFQLSPDCQLPLVQTCFGNVGKSAVVYERRNSDFAYSPIAAPNSEIWPRASLSEASNHLVRVATLRRPRHFSRSATTSSL